VPTRPILIIDDDPEVCTLVTSVLKAAGFAVEAAFDGASGIEKARMRQPAVILLDMMMPGMDGISTCQRLKQDLVLKDIPVVGITASPDLTFTAKAFRAGADFFLAKPFGAKSLLHVVELAAGSMRRQGPADQRKPRFTAEVPVGCLIAAGTDPSREIAGRTDNVSIGGLLLQLPEVVAPGTVCHLRLTLPDGALSAEGTVVWLNPQPISRGRYRHGVRLLRFAEDNDLVRYRRFLSQVARGHAAGANP
jgi:CheY-like chemotaxis protein